MCVCVCVRDAHCSPQPPPVSGAAWAVAVGHCEAFAAGSAAGLQFAAGSDRRPPRVHVPSCSCPHGAVLVRVRWCKLEVAIQSEIHRVRHVCFETRYTTFLMVAPRLRVSLLYYGCFIASHTFVVERRVSNSCTSLTVKLRGL